LSSFFALIFFSCVTMPRKPARLEPGDYSYLKEYLSWYIPRQMEKHDIVGLSIALVDGNATLWEQGFGFSNRESQVPATEKTLYKVASITKLFTATAIMQLVEEGRVNLDAPVTDYIPEFSIKSRFKKTAAITVRMLMTHHSGIPSDKGEGLFSENPESFHSVLDYLKGQYLSFPPGHMFCYSNLGVALLGIIIERVSGSAYHEFVKERILVPLEMNDSFLNPDEKQKKLIAEEYSCGEKAPRLNARDAPSISLVSSAADLKRFMMLVTDNETEKQRPVLKKGTIDEMLKQQNGTNPLDFDNKVGLIWHMSRQSLDYPGRIVMHRGIALHHRSTMVILPDERIGVVILTNSDTGTEVAKDIADRALMLALETKKGFKPVKKKSYKKIPLDDMSKKFLPGSYATLKGLVNIKLVDSVLWVEIMEKTFKMIPHEDGMFALQYVFLGFIPDSIRIGVTYIRGRKVLVLEHFGQKTAVGEEYRLKPLSESWQKRCGNYRITNGDSRFHLFDSDLKLFLLDGSLTAKINSNKFSIGKLFLVLDPLSETEAQVRGLGRSAGETFFVRKPGPDSDELIEYSGFLFKKTD